MPELNLDPEEIKRLVEEKIKREVKVTEPEESSQEEEPIEKDEEVSKEIHKVKEEPQPSPPLPPRPPEKPTPSDFPKEPLGGDGGKVFGTLGDFVRGKVRVPGFKQYVTVSVSPAILLYHGIAIALNLVDKDTDLSSFVEKCVVDWMRWHGVELVVKVYPGMDMFLALQKALGKDMDKIVNLSLIHI